jgi:hypothetical protein
LHDHLEGKQKVHGYPGAAAAVMTDFGPTDTCDAAPSIFQVLVLRPAPFVCFLQVNQTGA